MLSYIIRRILLMFPTLLGITAVVFFVMAYSPGGVGASLLREGNMRPEVRKAMEQDYARRYGSNDSKPLQYLHWLNVISPIGFHVNDEGKLGRFGFKMPDLGTDRNLNRPVIAVIGDALPVTLLLNAVSIPIIYSIAILSGVYAARFRGKFADVASGLLFLVLFSLPTIWVGVMFIGFLANRGHVHWFPAAGLSGLRADEMPFFPATTAAGWQPGWLFDRLWHLVLPVITLSYGGFAILSKLTRGSMLENIQADFVRTARAKGVADRKILFAHVLRNALLPLITVSAGILPGLLGGSVVVENIFSIPGMGKLIVDATFTHDRELILAEALIGGFLGLLSLLIADIAYAVADPRVSYE